MSNPNQLNDVFPSCFSEMGYYNFLRLHRQLWVFEFSKLQQKSVSRQYSSIKRNIL